MYYVYAINSLIRKYIYVGLTSDIDKRIERHNKGWEITTKNYRPFRLVFLTIIVSRKEARLLEKYLKSGVGKEFLKSLK